MEITGKGPVLLGVGVMGNVTMWEGTTHMCTVGLLVTRTRAEMIVRQREIEGPKRKDVLNVLTLKQRTAGALVRNSTTNCPSNRALALS